jgi:hypothetical protein
VLSYHLLQSIDTFLETIDNNASLGDEEIKSMVWEGEASFL